MRSAVRQWSRGLAHAACLLLLTLCVWVSAAEKTQAVLLYDGKLTEQANLQVLAEAALQPHGDRIAFRTFHAGRAENLPFMRRLGLARKDAPVLLVMSSDAVEARITRRVPLRPELPGEENVRVLLAALKLPVPRSLRPAVAAGTKIRVPADGGAEEKRSLLTTAGRQEVRDGVRKLLPGAAVTYRLPLPGEIREADLRGELSGPYLVEWSEDPVGPWHSLMDSGRYFGPALDLLTQRTQPVAQLQEVLRRLPGDLFLRVRPRQGAVRPVELVGLEMVVLGRGQASGEAEWLSRADQLQRERLAAVLPAGVSATPLAGALTQDLVLETARSPYLLTGELLVGMGVRLTIEPGVTVKVLGNAAIRVQGRLVAKGTAEQPILFTPLQPRIPGDWRGIQFQKVGIGASGERSLLQYCRLVNADLVELPRFAGEISNTVLENCARGMVLREGGVGRIHHNRFLRCRQGMLVDGGAAEITENEWVDCFAALMVQALPAREPLRIEQNSFRDSRQSAVTLLRQPSRPELSLTLAGNHWSGTPEARLVGGGVDGAPVKLEPRLPTAPAGVGPGW